MKLVVVESPAKAKTINKYLGKDYKVLASYGHIRDLPSKNGSVDPDNDFAMVWEADSKSSKRISEIAAALKEAEGDAETLKWAEIHRDIIVRFGDRGVDVYRRADLDLVEA